MQIEFKYKIYRVLIPLVSVLIIATSGCDKEIETNLPIIIEILDNWEFREVGKTDWMDAEIPGVVHMDLLRHGIIDEPFFRENERELQWIDKKDWEYQVNFLATNLLLTKDQIILKFHGLDTYADVYLNDSLILNADNMFRTWEVDCKSLLTEGENNLRVYFHSPVKIGIPKFDNYKYLLPAINDHSEIGEIEDKKISVYTRKAHYHYGWDWGPRFVTSGIWRPIVIEGWNQAKIQDVYFSNKEITPETATIQTSVEIEATVETSAEIIIKDNSSGNILKKQEAKLIPGKNNIEFEFDLENPKLWWSNGLGDPHLYNFTTSLISNNQLLDENTVNFGVRTVELIREPDSIGEGFHFELNGVPVYAKGANYIPNDNFLTRVTREKYERTIQAAVESNSNMLRVWGGGIYENDIFYDLCDQQGIMVWQDFMFACNMYPDSPDFLESIKHEFIDNVKRLRKHPSIALWCGNNELIQAWHFWGWHHPEAIYQWSKEDSTDLWRNYQHIFHDIIPSVLSDLDTTRSYWPSSPAANLYDHQTLESGNYHYWKNRDQLLPVTVYEEIIPRFMAEYGLSSNPEYYSVKNFSNEDDLARGFVRSYARPELPVGQEPVKYGNSNYTTRNFRPAKDFRSQLYVSQLVNSYMIETAISAHRRNKPYNMGTLLWMFNECWPVRSSSAIDYYGRYKAQMYAMKRSYAEVILSSPVKSDSLMMYVVSDRLSAFDVQMIMELVDFDGNVLWKQEKNLSIPANTSILAYTSEYDDFLDPSIKTQTILRTRLVENGSVISEHIKYFVPFKDLDLAVPTFQKTITKTPSGYEIALTANTFAKSVFLTIESPVGKFSDNFFDLIPGEEKIIEFKSNQEAPDFENRLEIISLVDSYTQDYLAAQLKKK